MPIMLREVFEIENLNDYKVHFAKWNGSHQPLDVFTRDRREWQGWQEYAHQWQTLSTLVHVSVSGAEPGSGPPASATR